VTGRPINTDDREHDPARERRRGASSLLLPVQVPHDRHDEQRTSGSEASDAAMASPQRCDMIPSS